MSTREAVFRVVVVVLLIFTIVNGVISDPVWSTLVMLLLVAVLVPIALRLPPLPKDR